MVTLKKDYAKFRIAEIRKRLHSLWAEIRELQEEETRLYTEVLRTEFPCHCVLRNGDIGITDMVAFQESGRKSLSILGWVSDTLSADGKCLVCKGTGKPL